MDQNCKDVQVKLLLSQCNDEVIKHISHCESCWEAFMNIGLDEQQVERDVALTHKKQLLDEAADPSAKGDHRMEQFQLLSSLSFTPYAKKAFLDYYSTLEKEKDDASEDWKDVLARLEEVVYSKIRRKQRESQSTQDKIDAEMMMSVLDELGPPSGFLKQRKVYKKTEKKGSSGIRKLYRSKENRMLAGICGGLGEYFLIDPLFLRILFVAIFFAGGWPLLVYIFLYFFIPEEETDKQPVLTSQVPIVEGEVKEPKREHGVLHNLIVGVVLLFLFVCIYAPLLFGLAGISAASILMLFVPITLPHGPANHFFLNQFGLPAMLGAGSVSLLFFSLFFLVLSFVIRLHFKKALLSKNLQAIFVVFVVMSVFSTVVCAGLVFSEFKAENEITRQQEFEAPSNKQISLDRKAFAPLLNGHVAFRSLTIKAQKGRKNIKVITTVNARARDTILATNALRQLQWLWPKTKTLSFPSIRKKHSKFYFERAYVTMLVPISYSVRLSDLPFRVYMKGQFGKEVKIQHSSILKMEDMQATKIALQNTYGRVYASNVQANDLSIQNNRGRTSLANVDATLFHMRNYRGKIRGEDLRGTFDVINDRGRVRLYLKDYKPRLPSQLTKKPAPTSRPVRKHKAPTSRPVIAKTTTKPVTPSKAQDVMRSHFKNIRGKTRIYFAQKYMPTLEIHRLSGRVKNRLGWKTPNKKIRFTIHVDGGKVYLLPQYKRHNDHPELDFN